MLDRPCVAIVGTRRATAYAERVTRELARTLARAGACVVSGLARGVDASAHLGALEVNGATVAVLGTGLDVVYPKGHAALQREIAEKGLLLSELAPANAAHGGSFPRRNRIIAALASATIVVEAGVKSGALITAGHALELGRTVAAVPGPIDVPQSQGSNELIRDGAVAITSMADVLALLGLTAPVRTKDLEVGGSERLVWDALALGGADLDTLCTRSGLPAHEGLAAVGALELRGLVECALTGEIRRM
jgi:DNA processing protein